MMAKGLKGARLPLCSSQTPILNLSPSGVAIIILKFLEAHYF
jgi:hypothetical protein